MKSFLRESRNGLLKKLFFGSFGRSRSSDLILKDAGLTVMFFGATRPATRQGILFYESIRTTARRGCY